MGTTNYIFLQRWKKTNRNNSKQWIYLLQRQKNKEQQKLESGLLCNTVWLFCSQLSVRLTSNFFMRTAMQFLFQYLTRKQIICSLLSTFQNLFYPPLYTSKLHVSNTELVKHTKLLLKRNSSSRFIYGSTNCSMMEFGCGA